VLIETRNLLAAELAGRSAAELAEHPGGEAQRWNARQVVEHLLATWRLTTHGMEDRLSKGRPLLTRPTPGQRFWQWVICNLGYFPPRREAPGATRPPAAEAEATMSGDELIAHLTTVIEAMDAAIERMEPFAAGRVALTHMVLGPLTVRQWRRFHRVHARHHARQMRAAVGGAAN
jgi:hypothetical protein